jgi:hypothetical protein
MRRRKRYLSPAKARALYDARALISSLILRSNTGSRPRRFSSGPDGGTIRLLMARIAAILAAGLILSLALGAADARTTASVKPVLQLIQRTPLKIQGLHFKAGERVRITATTPRARQVLTTRSNRRGRLVALFRQFSAPDCLRLTVTAVGARGDRATLVVNPPPTLPVPCPS